MGLPERMKFGIFLGPFHRVGENPTLAIDRDLELVQRLDHLGYDEAWIGEHHSAGWETISSPELFMAVAADRTRHIKLGTGVVSLPYHHPFMVANRMVQLDHMTHGRVMLGVGPGALPGDAYMMGIDPTTQREKMDESLGIILRLFTEDAPITYHSPRTDTQHHPPVGHVVQLHHAVGDHEGMVVGQTDNAGAQFNMTGTVGGHSHEQLRGGDGFPTGAVVLPNPGLIIAQVVQPLDQLQVPINGQSRVFSHPVEGTQEDAELHPFW